ncbi:hypothetical protein G9A89_012331 [Geosiphon pyriformis]|nr:hypothetical protein G9A89_012331 [Geosiphon pyriformis]
MASTRAVAALDWSKLTVSLGLQKETVAALLAFRKRNEEAKRVVFGLKESLKSELDFDHYRNILKNKGLVNEAEKVYKNLKPTKVDLAAQLKVIETFEKKAVERAKNTAARFDSELRDLHLTLSNIQDARPFPQLTVDEVAQAVPEIDVIVEKMVKKGVWDVPTYSEKFGV